jgi:hypothetical protein
MRQYTWLAEIYELTRIFQELALSPLIFLKTFGVRDLFSSFHSSIPDVPLKAALGLKPSCVEVFNILKVVSIVMRLRKIANL